MTLAELRDETRRRDSAVVGNFLVKHTEVQTFLDDVRADHSAGAIEASIVRLAVVNAPASLEQVTERWVPGGERKLLTYRSKYVSAAYVARGQVVKGSFYCGVAWCAKEQPDANAARLTKECAEHLQATNRRVQRELYALDGLDVRGGGVFVDDGSDWIAHYLEEIAMAPELTCAVCKEPVYFANGSYRAKSTGQAEALDEVPCVTCKGVGVVVRAGREQRCTGCLGHPGVIRVTNHVHGIGEEA